MNLITLIVEGKEDARFLQDFIQHRFKVKTDDSTFVKVGGKADRLDLEENKKIIQQRAEKGTNILLFDADNNFQATKGDISQRNDDHDLKIKSIFLFPDNKSIGNLEALLRGIIVYPELFNCIDQYIDCIEKLNVDGLSSFDDKRKVYIYHDSFSNDKKKSSKGVSRVYTEKWWDLNSESLTPLYDFLRPHFVE